MVETIIKRNSKEDKEKALELRNQGLSYYKISKTLKYSWETIKRWCNEEHTTKTNKKRKELYNSLSKEQKMQMRYKTSNELLAKCKLAISKCRTRAKNFGYKECLASVEELLNSYTGRCHICDVPEIECKLKLAMDHDHITGKFRGWLCHSCNSRILGGSGDNSALLRRAADYLDNLL